MSGAQQSLAMCEGCGVAGEHLGPFEVDGRSWERLCVPCKRGIVEADPRVLAQIDELRAARAALAARSAEREVAEAARAAWLGDEPVESVDLVPEEPVR